MNKKTILPACLLLAVGCGSASATPVDQYASSVIGYSTQWSSGNWSAAQALGAPDTFTYGDIFTAWAPSSQNGTLEYITLGYTNPVYATGATIRETDGNGFVYQIDVLDTNNVPHMVWSGTDGSQPGSPVDFLATWSTTNFLVNGLKIYTNTSHNPNTWEEIDSVALHGDTQAPTQVPEPASLTLMGLGLAAVLRKSRRKATA